MFKIDLQQINKKCITVHDLHKALPIPLWFAKFLLWNATDGPGGLISKHVKRIRCSCPDCGKVLLYVDRPMELVTGVATCGGCGWHDYTTFSNMETVYQVGK